MRRSRTGRSRSGSPPDGSTSAPRPGLRAAARVSVHPCSGGAGRCTRMAGESAIRRLEFAGSNHGPVGEVAAWTDHRSMTSTGRRPGSSPGHACSTPGGPRARSPAPSPGATPNRRARGLAHRWYPVQPPRGPPGCHRAPRRHRGPVAMDGCRTPALRGGRPGLSSGADRHRARWPPLAPFTCPEARGRETPEPTRPGRVDRAAVQCVRGSRTPGRGGGRDRSCAACSGHRQVNADAREPRVRGHAPHEVGPVRRRVASAAWSRR